HFFLASGNIFSSPGLISGFPSGPEFFFRQSSKALYALSRSGHDAWPDWIFFLISSMAFFSALQQLSLPAHESYFLLSAYNLQALSAQSMHFSQSSFVLQPDFLRHSPTKSPPPSKPNMQSAYRDLRPNGSWPMTGEFNTN